MSSYLELVNVALEECAMSGDPLVTVANQIKERKRLVNWVNRAWLDIQRRRDVWLFMRASTSFPTVLHQQSYTPAQANTTNFANWKRDSFRIYTTSLNFKDEYYLPYRDYEIFRNFYMYGNNRFTYNRPTEFTIDPAKNLLLGQAPNSANYTVIGDYYTKPIALTLDADIPTIPDRYEMAIVYRAKMFYGSYESAPDAFEQGKAEFYNVLADLEEDQLPPVDLGDPML